LAWRDKHQALERCALFAREIAELKLMTVGPLPATIDRRQIYAQLFEVSKLGQVAGLEVNIETHHHP
jgi:hypothetical protein